MDKAETVPPEGLRTEVVLAPLTTLEIGGVARWLVEVDDELGVVEALAWADVHAVPVFVLAGGSNVVIADSGFDGLVIQLANRGFEINRERDRALVTVAAGEDWDDVVAKLVEEKVAGVECLSGIPGSAGATPIQNVGAYGQEVADRIERVRAIDRRTLEIRDLRPEECGFGYRTSRFRREPDRFLVLGFTMQLMPGDAGTVSYPELEAVLSPAGTRPPLGEVRAAVLELRASKSMVIDTNDPNRRSVGSFFVNPVLDRDQHDDLKRRVLQLGITASAPSFPTADGGVKVPAAWLIERSGFERGHREGAVGLSSKHTLAIVNHGGGTAGELVALAKKIRGRVEERFGIQLQPEPVFVGFTAPNPLDDP